MFGTFEEDLAFLPFLLVYYVKKGDWRVGREEKKTEYPGKQNKRSTYRKLCKKTQVS
jgi:hypothetical protein